MEKKALIIYTRIPRPGATKTRLRTRFTDEECAGIHQAVLKDMGKLCQSREWDTFVYYTAPSPVSKEEMDMLQITLEGAKDFRPQPDTQFGERMYTCIKEVLEMGYDSCLLIGSDIPEMDVPVVQAAFAILDTKDTVIVPTLDRGYCLIGMKKPVKEIFDKQTYGTGDVYGDTIEKIKNCGCSYGTLPPLLDIDEPEDVDMYYKRQSIKKDGMHKETGAVWHYILRLMKRTSLCILLCAALCVNLVGCSSKNMPDAEKSTATTEDNAASDDEEIDDGRFHGEYLVDGAYVKDHIGSEDVLFVDARGWKQAVLGTVKGAIATTWQDLSTCQEGEAGDENWGKIPDPAELSKRLGELGITKDKEIILIADTSDGWGDDARILWELVAAGYPDVKMVDGGYKAAKEAGADTQMLASGAEPGKVSIDKIDNTHVMSTEELQNNYEEYTIVDVRTDEEYEGAVLHNEAKGGHLPGAIHLRYTDLFQEDGTLKPNKEIIAMCEAAGIKKDDKIVAYCTGGIRSAYMQVVLEMCGYENTWNYDQSYWRWCVIGEVE